jgi:hypothetical protein
MGSTLAVWSQESVIADCKPALGFVLTVNLQSSILNLKWAAP